MEEQIYDSPKIISMTFIISREVMSTSWFVFSGSTEGDSFYAPDGGSFELIDNAGSENEF